ncbi:MAG: helix-turn-helix domain-containing protein [Acidipropionibacterium sp.]|jgi:transcriptional regulator with XRE-family HTH domain|nr:helix-turn-helix domain-containing protein [Acidipropionibacterium sp.]
METIGERVRERINSSDVTQAEIAKSAGLTAPQLSKSLSGRRQFSAPELAKIANSLNVSLHWLVTGAPDPMEVRIAARHSYDDSNRTYSADGAETDQETLHNIALLYRQAYR